MFFVWSNVVYNDIIFIQVIGWFEYLQNNKYMISKVMTLSYTNHSILHYECDSINMILKNDAIAFILWVVILTSK